MITSTAPPALHAHRLHQAYGAATALDGVTLTVHHGESVAVMGASGCGKTTLLHCLAGIVVPDRGGVTLDVPGGPVTLSAASADQRAVLRRSHLGFVFQQGLLLPELTALENVAVAAMLAGTSRREAERAGAGLLGRLGLDGLGGRRIGQLSGGQAQRVAIARSQVNRPAVTFADEPTGALDSRTSEEVMSLLLAATSGAGTTLVVVTHDESVAARCARVVRMRDGRVVSDAVPAGAVPAGTAAGALR
ncbi:MULTISPECIES: ABC transporter ATP-binding protein [unclassified Kocuria]|uniref:ABC transporter ATP-binding protein n=1 Tax=unclassified Kocuria TaxID=2649579 RepID=UPI00064A218E|nr:MULTISPECIES: ABC transporter ATP-binding protein [unclassified Kocuria]KLU08582.1 ABC transporter ATP-binding protein [Kocuria sp. SM24M-10]OLT06639.1 ABC transporter ATP-binding protein [Kocuria sp. CNJ-770]